MAQHTIQGSFPKHTLPVYSNGLVWLRRLLPILLGAVALGLWTWLTRDGGGFMRATPGEVLAAYGSMISSGALLQHITTTLAEVALGYFMGVSLAFILGYGVSRVAVVEKLVLPYLVGLQAIPIVAVAPIIITYLGPGLFTNGLICALIVFFPMLITTNVAIRSIDHDKREFMRLMSATWWQTFTKLEIPAALPIIFGGLKVSTTLAVIGAVVGEGVSAEHGLGYLVYYSRYVFNQSSVMVGLFTLMIVAYGLYWLVAQIERYSLRWQR
ncbi:MAG: ABC transporter permease [Anaerolineae bacterium]|nr:ABC transporter permease [Anaerolineae bacterium]